MPRDRVAEAETGKVTEDMGVQGARVSSRGPGRKGEGGRLTRGREASVESVIVAQEEVAVTAAPEVTELTQERRPGGLVNVIDNYRHTVKFHPRQRCMPVLLQTQLPV